MADKTIKFHCPATRDAAPRFWETAPIGSWEAIYNAKAERERNILGQKLKEARKAAGLSQRQLAGHLAQCGVDVRLAAVSKWEQGLTVPSAYQFLALCHLLGIDDAASYFSGTAQPPMPELNHKGQQKMREYHDLLIASGMYAPQAACGASGEADALEIRTFVLPACAGDGLFTDSDEYELKSYPASMIPAGTDVAVRISGDSMTPYYVDGQTVFVEQAPELSNGDIGIFMLNGDALIKKYIERQPDADELESYTDSYGRVHPKILLRSLNSSYADKTVGPDSTFMIVGRVLN